MPSSTIEPLLHGLLPYETKQLLPQKLIVALFTALGANVALKAEHIAEITELPEVKPALEVLLRRNLIQANDEVIDKHYNLTSNLIKELEKERENAIAD